ncbi:MAG: copper resistance protein NlpE [Porphyromonas sp.]|nr:copper resistance protein NlpE [Porphyromonas sp.]
MKKISYLLVASAALLLASCTGEKSKSEDQTTAETTEMEVVEETPAYVGSYEGTLPCADCSGIATKLIINEDMTYALTSEYLEKEDGLFEENGTYEVIDIEGGQVLALTAGDNKTYYRVLDNAVALVADETGTLTESELAEHYILAKVVEVEEIPLETEVAEEEVEA